MKKITSFSVLPRPPFPSQEDASIPANKFRAFMDFLLNTLSAKDFIHVSIEVEMMDISVMCYFSVFFLNFEIVHSL